MLSMIWAFYGRRYKTLSDAFLSLCCHLHQGSTKWWSSWSLITESYNFWRKVLLEFYAFLCTFWRKESICDRNKHIITNHLYDSYNDKNFNIKNKIYLISLSWFQRFRTFCCKFCCRNLRTFTESLEKFQLWSRKVLILSSPGCKGGELLLATRHQGRRAEWMFV